MELRAARRLTLPAAFPLLLAAACDSGADLSIPTPTAVDPPAASGAALPHVAGTASGAILSWVEPAGAGHALRYSTWDGRAWTEPGTVAAGENWFVNWADFPSVIALDDRSMAAHWLQRSGPGTYAYDVMVARSSDGGATWAPPVRPHADGTETEHGFVSLFPGPDRSLGVTWLDGRKYAASADEPATNEMTVRFAWLNGAAAAEEVVLDERACDCCQTDVALTTAGPLVVYRDRSPEEVRDIAVTRLTGDGWSEPRVVHADGWVIDACPVNGPQVDAHGSAVAVAWFTAARDTPRVQVAFSSDDGATFGAPVRVDGGNPAGRVDLVMLDGDRALVVWLERAARGAELRGRLVTRGGQTGEPAVLAQTVAQRPSGFPRMARFADGVLLAWTEPGEASRVRAATLELPAR